MLKKLLYVLAIAVAAIAPVWAADGSGDPAAGQGMTKEQFMASLHFKTGKIKLPNGIATLDMPPSFRYLGPDDSERLLEDAWGNPPDDKPLGMIFPADVSPLSDEGWGVVITYQEDGHVKDDDANKIDYNDLLKKMTADTADANEERIKKGYPSMLLAGWAEQPHYDSASHKLYWALNLKTGNASVNTLNYKIRVLGRKGVLVLNAIAGMNQLPVIKTEMQNVIGFTDFTPGNRYADFNSHTDKVAEYGIAALVAGGIAAKMGLFAKLIAVLIAAKKAVLVALVAVAGGIRKLLGMKKKET